MYSIKVEIGWDEIKEAVWGWIENHHPEFKVFPDTAILSNGESEDSITIRMAVQEKARPSNRLNP